MANDTTLRIQRGDLGDEQTRTLLARHLHGMAESSPAEAVHAMDEDALLDAEVELWTATVSDRVAGIAGLKTLGNSDGEIKSMRVHDDFLGHGVGRALVRHLIAQATHQGLDTLWLETGSSPAFEPALRLYESEGFVPCGPFGAYEAHPFSVFMNRPVSGDDGSR